VPSGKQKRERKQKRTPKRVNGLKSKLERGPFRDKKLVIEPACEVKMSDVLADFIKPYRGWADTEEAYRKLLTLAILAWNASFLPTEEQQAMIDNVIDGGLPAATEELKNGLKQIVHMLMARKRAYFSAYRRNIIDYELTDTGKGYRLSVASTLEEVGPQD
jgi:hypothetical protein